MDSDAFEIQNEVVWLSEDSHGASTSEKKRVRRIGKWSPDEQAKLIALFEERPSLWDFTKNDYRDRVLRAAIIADIAKILNKERNEIEAQWNNLRGQFRRTLSKLAQRKSDEQVNVSFPYFERMSFLNLTNTVVPQRYSNSGKKRVRRIGKWSPDKLTKLIALFKERPSLWDFTRKEYRDRVHRAEEMANIAKILNKERSEIEAQWNNLRGQFRRTVSKLAQRKSGLSEEKVNVRFPYFEQMSFLKLPNTDVSQRYSNSDDDSSSLCEEHLSSATPSPLLNVKRQRKVDEKSTINANAYENTEAMFKCTSNQTPIANDAFDPLGATVAALLRELESKLPIVRHELQVNIQQAILNAQTKLYNHELNNSLKK